MHVISQSLKKNRKGDQKTFEPLKGDQVTVFQGQIAHTPLADTLARTYLAIAEDEPPPPMAGPAQRTKARRSPSTRTSPRI